MTRLLGIDFSGAKDAGRKIWIAEGRKSEGPLFIDFCRPACDLPGKAADPAQALSALARHIIAEPNTIAGCDFPFSLPRQLIKTRDWRSFALAFKRRFKDAQTFHDLCHKATGGVEVKRRTDKADKTPFNSFNLRLYRQTWWGIAHFLAPLVADDAIVVRPQMEFKSRRPILVEVCAASSLIRLDCYPSYKGRLARHRRARSEILDRLIALSLLAPPTRALRRLLLDNAGGDALDAIIGAIAVNKAKFDHPTDAIDRIEGKVYFDLLS